MSIVYAREIHRGRQGDESLGTDGQVTRRYVRVFRVRTNSPSDGPRTIWLSGTIPAIGAQYPSDLEAFLRRRRPTQDEDSKLIWLVTCEYSSERELNENPLAEPARIHWETEQFQRVYSQDSAGNAIVNSAGDPLDPPLEGDDSRWTAVVRKNVAAVPSWLLNYRDAVNSDSFALDGLTISPNEAKLQSITISDWQERNDVSYRVLTMRIQLREDDGAEEQGWTQQVQDAGFRRIDPNDATKRINITDDNEERPTAPVLLDGAGAPLANPSASNAVYLDFDIYRQQAFGSLPLS